MADEMKRVDVFMGPYRGNLLDMTAADAQSAINSHWARDPYSTEPYGTGHDALSDEERAAAFTAANEWAQAQWNPAPPAPPPEGGESGVTRRSMQGQPGGSYVTKKV